MNPNIKLPFHVRELRELPTVDTLQHWREWPFVQQQPPPPDRLFKLIKLPTQDWVHAQLIFRPVLTRLAAHSDFFWRLSDRTDPDTEWFIDKIALPIPATVTMRVSAKQVIQVFTGYGPVEFDPIHIGGCESYDITVTVSPDEPTLQYHPHTKPRLTLMGCRKHGR